MLAETFFGFDGIDLIASEIATTSTTTAAVHETVDSVYTIIGS